MLLKEIKLGTVEHLREGNQSSKSAWLHSKLEASMGGKREQEELGRIRLEDVQVLATCSSSPCVP